jgi:hypothetical protein
LQPLVIEFGADGGAQRSVVPDEDLEIAVALRERRLDASTQLLRSVRGDQN